MVEQIQCSDVFRTRTIPWYFVIYQILNIDKTLKDGRFEFTDCFLNDIILNQLID